MIVRAPMRISFVGGGSDLPEYYQRFGGIVVSSTINLYNVVQMVPLDGRSAWEFTAFRNTPATVSRYRTPLVEAAVRKYRCNSVGFTLTTDLAEPGSGLGSSSALAVALTLSLACEQNGILSPSIVAEEAFSLERVGCGSPVGKQDHYASAYGGLNEYIFHSDGHVAVQSLSLCDGDLRNLQDRLLLFRVPRINTANDVLKSHASEISNSSRALEAQHEIVELAVEFKKLLQARSFDCLGLVLHKSWSAKKSVSSKISSAAIDSIYERAMAAGALGGKVLGAGAGGHIMFFVDPANGRRVRETLADLVEVPFAFTSKGAELIHGVSNA
jgi:D-glycero-alpha-D-manno-heptose-7-phosphate kinase